jgi:hypothetical protein
MIDTRSEPLLSLAEAAEVVRKHVATVYRWSTTGFRGVILETIQVGGTRCTSYEALQRFCERLTGSGPYGPARRSRESCGSVRAAEELERHGI